MIVVFEKWKYFSGERKLLPDHQNFEMGAKFS
jgi:hypothetical protein